MQKSAADDVVREGLWRLAFGKIGDAVKLLCEDPERLLEEVSEYDLFNVSKIRKGRDGFEIEIFDRQKALDALEKVELSRNSGREIAALYEALNFNAKKTEGAGAEK